MMWTTDELGLGIWRDAGSKWYIDARGGRFGIGVIAPDRDDVSAFDAPARYVSFTPVDQDSLPRAGEQYVRGDCWHLNYPQGTGSYALRLALQPISTNANLLVLEATVAIQTDLLDTYPKIDVDALCRSIDSIVPTDPSGDDEVKRAGSAPISISESKSHCVSVLLGPHDSPFTTNHSTDSLLRLRLFGDFLEKGVIRKARPWIVIDKGGGITPEDQLVSWWRQLCRSPLPLT